VSGIWLVARADVRRRWRSYVALGVLAGLLGAAAVACLAGARRTSTVPERLGEVSGAWDAVAVAYDAGGGGARAEAIIDEVATAPGVRDVQRFAAPVGRALGSLDWFYLFAFEGDDGFYRPPLVRGRWPAAGAADEIVVSQATAAQPAYSLGAVVPYQVYRPEQLDAVGQDNTVLPAGERFDLRVVGVVRDLADLSPATQKLVLGGPALHDRLLDAGASPGALVRLDTAQTSASEFQLAALTAADEQGLLGPGVLADISLRLEDETLNGPFATMSDGLRVIAAIAALVSVVVLLQAVGRQVTATAAELDVLAALGITPAGRAAARVMSLAVSALVAAATTLAGAIALSALFPLGSLRRLEPANGVHVDVPVVVLGALAVAAAILLIGVVVSARAVHRRPARGHRPHAWVEALARAGAGPYQVAGAQFALQPGRARRAVPIRAALGGAALGVAGVVGAMVVVTNLERLVTTPQRYGAPADLALETSVAGREEFVAELARDADVDAVGIQWSTRLATERGEIGAYALEPRAGELAYTVVEGRAPVTDGEVALGANALADLGVDLGDTVELGAPGEGSPLPFVVVGEVLTPLDSGDDFAGQAVTTRGGFSRLGLREGLSGLTGEVALRVRPGADVWSVYQRLDQRFPAEVQDEAWVARPAPVDLLSRVSALAWVLAGVAGLAGAAGLVHALSVGLRRRRRDLGVLRAFGATPTEAARAMRWMAVTVAVVGIAVGLPAGLLGGAFVWRRIASSTHVVADVAVPAPAVALVMVATLAVAVLVAAPSGWRARRLRVVDVLHSE
jgi:hypothetical protein